MDAGGMSSMSEVRFRPADEKDVPTLLWLIQLLAEDEKEPHAVKIGTNELLRDGFGKNPYFKVILAELTSPLPTASSPPEPSSTPLPPSASMEKDESVIGYALYFFNYSTWEGRVLYLEDLYIRAEYRNRGFGTNLMKEVAKIADDRGCCRMVWQCLDWNTKAMDLYERVGGKCLREWLTIRMYQPNIHDFANSLQEL